MIKRRKYAYQQLLEMGKISWEALLSVSIVLIPSACSLLDEVIGLSQGRIRHTNAERAQLSR